MYGLSESRRYLHIRHHWQEGYTMDDWEDWEDWEGWKSGEDRYDVMPLTSEEADTLLGMSLDDFRIAAKDLLKTSAGQARSNTAAIKGGFAARRHRAGAGDLAVPSDNIVEGQKGLSSAQPQVTPEVVRPMVHGLFASIRETFLRMHTKLL
jgi:hypothetical protein